MKINNKPEDIKEFLEDHIYGQVLQDQKLERLQEAKQYLGYCIKEGALDVSDVEGKTDDELIEMSDELMAKADAWADAIRKGEA